MLELVYVPVGFICEIAKILPELARHKMACGGIIRLPIGDSGHNYWRRRSFRIDAVLSAIVASCKQLGC